VFQRTYWCNIGRTTCATRDIFHLLEKKLEKRFRQNLMEVS